MDAYMKKLEITIAGVTLPNPVMPASGTYEYTPQHTDFFSPSILGAVVNKTVFSRPRPGNPPPRICETPSGMLNAIGIPSPGIDEFIKKQLPVMAGFGVPVIVSVAGSTVKEFCTLTEKIAETGKADMIELNLSCPNLQEGTEWAKDKEQLFEVVRAVTRISPIPVVPKLSPSVTDIAEMASIAEDAGAHAVALINTYKGLKIDITTRKPLLGNITGGLSGPAVLPLAVYAVWEVFKRVSIPIIGMGGVHSWESTVEMMLAGASAVGVGMYNFINPMCMKEIIEGLSRYADDCNLGSITQIIGEAHSGG